MRIAPTIVSAVSSLPRHGRQWPGLALLIALAVQTAFLLETATRPLFRFPLIDSASYHRQALAILAGTTPAEPFWQPPAYPYFLGAIYGLCGTQLIIARAVHAMLGVLLVGLTFGIARRLALSARQACVAAVVVALCGPLVFYSSQLLPAVPAAVLLLLALGLIFRADRLGTVRAWIWAGLGIGVATITVANMLVMLPVAAVLAWRRNKAPDFCTVGTTSGRLKQAGALLAATLLVIGLVSLRNRMVGGAWVAISTNGGINFYIGNNAHDEVSLSTQPGTDWERLSRLPWIAGARTPVEAERWFWRESLLYAAQHPGRFAGRMVDKLLAFWHGRELPRNFDLYGWRNESRVLAFLVGSSPGVFIPGGLLMPLGLLGLALALRRGRAACAAAVTVLLFSLSVALIFPASRYRVPVLPLLAIFAVLAIGWLWEQARARRSGWLGAGVAALVLLGVMANRPMAWPTDRVRYDAHLQNALGAAMDVRGDLTGAEKAYQTALALDPDFADAWFNLGTVRGRREDLPGAQSCYRHAIMLRPDQDRARVNLGVVLFRAGQVAAARRELEAALSLNPLNTEAQRNLQVLELRAKPLPPKAKRQ